MGKEIEGVNKRRRKTKQQSFVMYTQEKRLFQKGKYDHLLTIREIKTF